MASNAKNLAEYLNNETTSATADIADGSITTAKLADGGVTTAKVADNAVTSAKALNLGRRNLVINGAMQVAQRATSVTGLGGNAEAYYVVDRIKHLHGGTSAGRYTATQETITDLPGFGKALKLACTTADTSIAAGEFFGITHFFEGQNVQSIQKGHSTAKPLTVSFYVKGNASATYTAELKDTDNSRINGKTFSVTTDWTRVELTYPADTTGKLNNDNALSLTLSLYLHGGSTYTGGTFTNGTWASEVQANRISSSSSSFYDSTSRTFFITGLQLEVSSVASDFEHRSFAEELQLCYRYFYKTTRSGYIPGRGNGTTAITDLRLPTPVPMRAQPTFDATGTSYAMDSNSYVSASNVGFTFSNLSNNHMVGQITGLSAMTDNRMAMVSLFAGYSLDCEL